MTRPHLDAQPPAPDSRISIANIVIFTIILCLTFAIGAGIVAVVSVTSGASMVISHALLVISGSTFIGGLTISAIVRATQ